MLAWAGAGLLGLSGAVRLGVTARVDPGLPLAGDGVVLPLLGEWVALVVVVGGLGVGCVGGCSNTRLSEVRLSWISLPGGSGLVLISSRVCPCTCTLMRYSVGAAWLWGLVAARFSVAPVWLLPLVGALGGGCSAWRPSAGWDRLRGGWATTLTTWALIVSPICSSACRRLKPVLISALSLGGLLLVS